MLKLFILLLPFSLFAKDWGHLLTGSTYTLKEKEITAGLSIVGYGITDRLTIGLSPIAYFGYQFNSIVLRHNFYRKDKTALAYDLFYFSSISNLESDFKQRSSFFKLNLSHKLTKKTQLYITYGHQYFMNEDSPYSLRPDPNGKYRTYAIKTDDPIVYQEKLDDFSQNPRNKNTTSLSAILRYDFNRQSFVNFEYGILGLNYQDSLQHIGLSGNWSSRKWNYSLGLSYSYRETKEIGKENLFHPEIKAQYTF